MSWLGRIRSGLWVEDAPPVDIKRRGFIFGATAAALVVAAPKSFFILSPPKLIQASSLADLSQLKLDLPMQQMHDLIKKLDSQTIGLAAVPRWAVINKDMYDAIVGPPVERSPEEIRKVARAVERAARWRDHPKKYYEA